MLVADPGSVWSNSGTLIISGTSGNNLVISNGGQVFSDYGSLSGSSNLKSVMSDSVLVTGSNSLWSINNDFIITWRRNSLVIGNGGRVVSSYGYMGFNSVDISSVTGNLVVVTGPGSVWSNRNDLYVGYSGYKNSLVISNSGEVLNDDCYIGYNSSSSTNSVRVMDGAVWRSSAICVGYSGSSNSLLVAGGTVQATNLVIGFASALCNNLVRLDSGSVAVTNPAGDAVFEIRNGKLILSGGTLQVDRFVMTNACAQFVRTGGTLIYGTAVLDPNRDDDGDGLPNGWEQAHGLDPLNAADANVDSDGDGFTNLQEYLAGTDPQDSASSFRIIGIAPEGDDMRVTWMMGSGKTNALQAAAGDGGDYSNNFADIFTVTNTVGSQTNYLDLGAATNAPGRFYRVRLVP
jgi:T5SS/PEP-CTERM-associated repeat protein